METNYFPGKDCRQIPAFASAALCSEVEAGSTGFHQRGRFPSLPGWPQEEFVLFWSSRGEFAVPSQPLMSAVSVSLISSVTWMVLSQMSRAVWLPSFNKKTPWQASDGVWVRMSQPAGSVDRRFAPAPIKGTFFFFFSLRAQEHSPGSLTGWLNHCHPHSIRQTVPLTAVCEIDSDAAPAHPGHTRLCSRPALVEDPGLGQQGRAGRARPAKPRGCPTIREVPALAPRRGLSAEVVLSCQAGWAIGDWGLIPPPRCQAEQRSVARPWHCDLRLGPSPSKSRIRPRGEVGLVQQLIGSSTICLAFHVGDMFILDLSLGWRLRDPGTAPSKAPSTPGQWACPSSLQAVLKQQEPWKAVCPEGQGEATFQACLPSLCRRWMYMAGMTAGGHASDPGRGPQPLWSVVCYEIQQKPPKMVSLASLAFQ